MNNLGQIFLQSFYDQHYADDVNHKLELLKQYFFKNKELCTTSSSDKQELAVLEYSILEEFGFNKEFEV